MAEEVILDGMPIRKRVRNCSECIFLQRSNHHYGEGRNQYCSLGFDVELTTVVFYRINTWEDECSDIKPKNGRCLKTARAAGRRKTFGWLKSIGKQLNYIMGNPLFPVDKIQNAK